jgi:hypothetical protein
MRNNPPHKFINKYPQPNPNYYRVPGYTPEQVEAMKDPIILTAWQKGVKDWLDKWERKE